MFHNDVELHRLCLLKGITASREWAFVRIKKSLCPAVFFSFFLIFIGLVECPAVAQQPILFNTCVEGQIARLGQTVLYTFDAAQNQQITVGFVGRFGFSVTLEGPGLDPLRCFVPGTSSHCLVDGDPATPQIDPVTLPANGTYSLTVAGGAGSGRITTGGLTISPGVRNSATIRTPSSVW